jgi:hypothetical protein
MTGATIRDFEVSFNPSGALITFDRPRAAWERGAPRLRMDAARRALSLAGGTSPARFEGALGEAEWAALAAAARVLVVEADPSSGPGGVNAFLVERETA